MHDNPVLPYLQRNFLLNPDVDPYKGYIRVQRVYGDI